MKFKGYAKFKGYEICKMLHDNELVLDTNIKIRCIKDDMLITTVRVKGCENRYDEDYQYLYDLDAFEELGNSCLASNDIYFELD